MKLKCLRSSLDKDGNEYNQREEIHCADIRVSETTKEKWVYLSPGVTGYESASVNDILRDKRDDKSWPACAGTPNSWDRLVIPAQEMEKLKDILRLIQNL